MKVSIVILSYKVPHHLMLCLDSVYKAVDDINAEVIVVDNNSEDKSCSLIKKNYPKVKLIQNSDNLGFSKANNIGVKSAKGEYLCILNPDTVVPEDCFAKLLNHHNNLNTPGILGVQLIDGTGEFLEESKRNIPSPSSAFKKVIGHSKSYYNSKIDKDSNGPTEVLVGAFMFMKTTLFQDIGGFDEDYFMYGEDIDLSYRIEKAGFQNYYCGDIKVLHYKGESTIKDQVYLNSFFNAMYIFYKKHFKNYSASFRFVKQSLKLSMAFEKIRLKAIKVEPLHFKKAYLVSSDTCLYGLSKEKFSSPLQLISETESELKEALIIFDANQLEYKTCIETMVRLKARSNAFRIKPRNYTFAIGSESKYLKGEVIDLS